MPSRQYVDPSGTQWEVFEVRRLGRPGSVRPMLEAGWLAFVSATEKRRLAQYPTAWLELTDDELQELLRLAFIAPDAIYPFDPVTGAPIEQSAAAQQRQFDRRRVPRPEPQAAEALPLELDATAAAPELVSEIAATRTSAEELVRAHARTARKSGQHAVHALVAVKRALSEAGESTSPEMIKRVRRWFVEEFYFPG